MELTTSMPEPSRISIFLKSLTVDVDSLAGDFILSGNGSNGFPTSKTQLDFLNLLRSEGGLPTAPIVCVPLTGKGYSFGLSFSYQCPFVFSDRAKHFQVECLRGIGIYTVKGHSFLVEDNLHSSGKQVLYDV